MGSHCTLARATTRQGLRDSLNGFIVQSRQKRINGFSWHAMSKDLLACCAEAEEDLLNEVFIALFKQRSCVSTGEWNKFIVNARESFALLGKSKVFHDIYIKLNDKSTTAERSRGNKRQNSPISAKLTKKMRSSSQVTGANFPNDGSPLQSSAPQLTGKKPTAFSVLKSCGVLNSVASLALDDIVLAGADLAVICNFKVDVKWMWERAPALQTSRKVMIIHGETKEEELEWLHYLRGEGAESRVRFVRPPTPSYGTVHSKLFVIFYPSGCRICIHTANMVQQDWDYKTQGAYMRDFPRRDSTPIDSGRTTWGPSKDFQTQLIRYFERVLVTSHRDELVQRILQYDFSSAGAALVSSVPGIHKGPDRNYFGHARLRQLLHEEDIEPDNGSSVAICQFSSLGSIQQKWLDEEFHDTLFACKQFVRRPAKFTSGKTEIKLVFPTLEQVRSSNEGLLAGMSLPVSSKNLHRPHITSKLHKWDGRQCGRERAMPHIKTYLRYNTSQPCSPSWVFLGSFNLSVAAWGRMQGARGKQSWDRFNLLSYEVGVLLSPRLACPQLIYLDGTVKYSIPTKQDEELWEKARRQKNIALQLDYPQSSADQPVLLESQHSLLNVQVPLPYKVPPQPYQSQDVPWNTSFFAML